MPDRIIEDAIAMQRQYRCLLWSVETVQFQAFLYSELVKRAAIAGVPFPARGVAPIADKLLRIESLQPHMVNGLIRLHPGQTTLTTNCATSPNPTTTTAPTPCTCSGRWRLPAPGGSGDFKPYRDQGTGCRVPVRIAHRLVP
jgi:hypothetical protein